MFDSKALLNEIAWLVSTERMFGCSVITSEIGEICFDNFFQNRSCLFAMEDKIHLEYAR